MSYYDYGEIKNMYDTVINKDKKSFMTTNDEPTPIGCIEDMLSKVPHELWKRTDLKILDPCSGNGNFHIVCREMCMVYNTKSIQDIESDVLYFNDINTIRLQTVRENFPHSKHITCIDFTTYPDDIKFDMIVANPPYASLLPDGKRSSKNHNMIKIFLTKSLSLLKPGGYLVFITPDNWMSFADRNTIIQTLTSLQFHWLNVSAKKWFPKVGSSFTWYIIENTPFYTGFDVEGVWKKESYSSHVRSEVRKFIPLFYNATVQNIINKTIDNTIYPKIKIETSSDLHKFTKKKNISTVCDDIFIYKLIHTYKQTVYANRKHKYQDGWKVFITTTDTYRTFIDECGMTQSIAFVRCISEQEAKNIKKMLDHPLYVFLNNICRYGNFNNIRVLQNFPFPMNSEEIYTSFGISQEEISYIEKWV